MDFTLPSDDGLHRLRLRDGRSAIAKVRRTAPADFFAAEARGLDALRTAASLRVPTILHVSATAIVLEDLGAGRAEVGHWRRAGAQLAALHARRAPRFGAAADGWCGDGAQDNTPDEDGHAFFAQRRLHVQAVRAHAAARLDAHDRDRVERIAARLAEWIPAQPPALVHGDLWLGNLHACGDGELALIDGAAVHHGWAETDLAMATLFGEPPPAFFDAYQAAAGIDASWRERAPLYNLYHLLNHLNLFGSGYLGAVRAVLARFA